MHAYGSPIRLDFTWYSEDHATHIEWIAEDFQADMGMVPLVPGRPVESQMLDLAHEMVANGHDGTGKIHLRRVTPAPSPTKTLESLFMLGAMHAKGQS